MRFNFLLVFISRSAQVGVYCTLKMELGRTINPGGTEYSLNLPLQIQFVNKHPIWSKMSWCWRHFKLDSKQSWSQTHFIEQSSFWHMIEIQHEHTVRHWGYTGKIWVNKTCRNVMFCLCKILANLNLTIKITSFTQEMIFNPSSLRENISDRAKIRKLLCATNG